MKSITFLILLFFSFTAKANNYYFDATLGNDSRTSILAQNPNTPWQTIGKLNTFFSSLVAGDSVLFKRGETFYGTIVINKSGASGAPIVIGAYGTGARPEITGLIDLTWTSMGGNLWHSNAVLTTSLVFCVTVNNKISAMARWPQFSVSGNNGGWNTMNTPLSNTYFTQTLGSEISSRPPGLWASMKGSTVVVRAKRFWIDTAKITAFDSVAHTISFGSGVYVDNVNPIADGFGYFIENNPNLCTYQNAWYFDNGNNWLKIYSSGTPSNVAAANVSNLLTSSGFSWITVDNINFNGCNQDAIALSTGGNIKIQNCVIQNCGRNGFGIKSPTISILNDSIVNVQSNAVMISASGADGGIVKNCTIRNLGQLNGMGSGSYQDVGSHDGCGVYLSPDGADNWDISYNKFIVCGYSAVNVKRQNGISITYNYIDTTDNITDDGGAVYFFNNDNSVRTGRVCSHNIIRNGLGNLYGTPSTLDAGAGVAGIYNDKETNHVTEEYNYIEKFEKGIFSNYGTKFVTIQYNTIVDCDRGLQWNTRAANQTRNNICEHNLLFMKNSADFAVRLFNSGDNLTSFGVFDLNYYIKPLVPAVAAANSFLYSEGPNAPYTIAEWRAAFGYDINTKTGLYDYTSLTQQTDSTIIKFNYSASTYTGSMSGTYKDIYGTSYTNTYNVPAYSSVILFKAPNTGVPTPPAPTNNNIRIGRKHLKVP